MINLLPYDTKQQIQAARINFVLVRYLVLLVIAAGFLALTCFGAYFFINNSSLFANTAVQNTSASKLQADSATIKTNLAKAKTILNQQISYSKVLTAITSALPTGTKLNKLSINDGSFGTTTSLSVQATKADLSNALKTNFSNPQFFANFKQDSSTSSQDPTSKYPFTINISFTINKGAAL